MTRGRALSASVALLLAGLVWAQANSNAPHEMSLRLELFVKDIEKSTRFYTSVLCFDRVRQQADYVSLRSGTVLLGLGSAAGLQRGHYFQPELATSRRGLGTEIVLEVDDVHALFLRVKDSRHARILAPLKEQPWGLTDFRIADPDGYYLRITSR